MTILTVAGCLDVVLLVMGAVLAWRAPRVAPLRDLVWLVIFTGVVMLGVGGVTRAMFGGFGMLRGVAHALFCVALPVVGVRAVRLYARHPIYALSLFAIMLCGEGCYVWARRVEPFRLEVTRREIESPRLAKAERALGRPLRVACLADLQTDAIGAYEHDVIDEIVAFEPDLVLLLGDYLQLPLGDPKHEIDKLRALLRRLEPGHGTYAVDGDVDGGLGGVRRLFSGTNVTPLVDDRVAIDALGVEVVGLSRARSRMPFVDVGTARSVQGERFPIVIGHAPDFMRSVLDGGYDPDALLVAGHTHGGQVQVPGFGPLLTLSSVPRWLAGGGVFERGRAWLVCSRGVGLERSHAPRIRFWCRPQLILLELRGPR